MHRRPVTSPNKVATLIRLDPRVMARLDALCRAERISRAEGIRRAIGIFLAISMASSDIESADSVPAKSDIGAAEERLIG